MTLSELQTILGEKCRRHAVKSMKIFGSHARGQAIAGSDLDLLVQFHEMPPSDYAREYFSLLHDLEDALKCTIDLLTPASIKRQSLKSNISKEAILIYEA